MTQRTFQSELNFIVGLIGVMWCAFLLDALTPLDLRSWGLMPRDLSGLTGIVAMPLVHGGWGHIVGNTVPLFVLLVLLAGSQARSVEVVVAIWLLGGALLWVAGRGGRYHVGASGVIYGLIAFLIVAGFRERRPAAMVAALVTGFLYGTTLFYGVLPSYALAVSWDGHLAGAIAGAAMALMAVRPDSASVG